MKNKILTILKNHKILTFVIIAAVAGGGWYLFNGNNSDAAQVSYLIGKVEKGAVITSVSGTGQVAATNQVDIKPKISAQILSIGVKSGQTVKAGNVLAKLDTKDLQKDIRNAKNSLDSALASYNLKIAGVTPEDEKVAKNSVETARLSYENSLTSLENAKKSAEDDLAKAQRGLEDAQRTYDNALASQGVNTDTKTSDLDNTYTSAKTSVNTAYSNLRASVVLIDGILSMKNYNTSESAYKNSLGVRDLESVNRAKASYEIARSSLLSFEADYQSTAWTKDQTEALLTKALPALEKAKKMCQDTYTVLINSVTSTDLSETTLSGLKSSVSSQETSAGSGITSLNSSRQSIASAKLNQTSGDISNSGTVGSAKSSLENAKNNLELTKSTNNKNIQSAESDVKSKKLAWENSQANYYLKIAKPRAVDIASYKIQITQARNNYNEASSNLSEATITSPIDGVVAKIYQNAGDLSSLSQSTPLVTVVTNTRMATIDLNEVDAAKVKIGQKATLTFNAIDGLEITGSVVEVDGVGTVTQGVVNYTVQIALDTQDDRIKPEMSVSATITTDQKLDTLAVPNSAIKTDPSGLSYVEILKGASETTGNSGIISKESPEIVYVQAGLSSDENTEITDGLVEGDLIITKTVSNTSASNQGAAGQQNSAFRMMGGGGAGGAVRVTR